MKHEVVIEAIGTVQWSHVAEHSDGRWRGDRRVALVRVNEDHGMRYLVTDGQCYRNGTTISEAIVGCLGMLEVEGGAAKGFSCPTMFGTEPKRIVASQSIL